MLLRLSWLAGLRLCDRHALHAGVGAPCVGFFVVKDLAAYTVHLELEDLRAGRVFLEQLAQLIEAVEEADAAASVEVARLDEPDVAAVKHRISKAEARRTEVLIFQISGKLTVFSYLLIDLADRAPIGLRALYRVEVLTEAFNLLHVLAAQIDNELSRHEVENVRLDLLTVPVHVQE